jgi:hypothetical protein
MSKVPWETRFEELKRWKEDNNVNHCRVRTKEKPLGVWVANQRVLYQKGKLKKDRVEKLKEINFEFCLEKHNMKTKQQRYEVRFNEMYDKAKKFSEEHGHCRITSSHGELGIWARDRRVDFWNKRLSIDRVILLTKIGFEWKVKAGRIPDKSEYKVRPTPPPPSQQPQPQQDHQQ